MENQDDLAASAPAKVAAAHGAAAGVTTDITPTDADRKALARTYECFEDGQDTDVGRPALNRLVALGWLDRISQRRWQQNDDGDAIMREMGLL